MGQKVKKSDTQLEGDVREELKWDTRVKDGDVVVTVKDGTVALSGTVDSWASRLAAQEAAHRVSGVLDVANDIDVRLPGTVLRTDAEIAHSVRQTLEWDILVPHQRIHSTVSNGVVLLEGSVDYWSQCDDASRAIRNLAGVREVRNLLTVDPKAPRASSDTIRGAIERALERHAEHSAKRVHITISDGTVVLTGEVPSWAERVAVEGAVRGTPGVWRVESQLRIHS